MRFTRSNTCCTMTGASPADGSSSRSSFGLGHQGAADRAHLLLAAGHGAGELAAPLAQAREQLVDEVEALAELRPRGRHEAAHLAGCPRRSCAGTAGGSPARGRCPSSTIRWAGVATRSTPSMTIEPARRPDQAGDDPHQRGLAGAVGADDADRLARAHLERDVEQRLEGPVAGADRPSARACGRVSRGRRRRRARRPPGCRDRPRSRAGRRRPAAGRPSAIFSPWSSTITRSTTRISTPMMCSTQMMVMPQLLRRCGAACRRPDPSRARRGRSGSRRRAGASAPVASALASSSFLSAAAPRPSTVAARSVGKPTSSSARSAASKRPRSASAAPGRRSPASTTFSRMRQPAERPRDLEGAADAEVDDPVRRLPADLPPLEADRAARWGPACRTAC